MPDVVYPVSPIGTPPTIQPGIPGQTTDTTIRKHHPQDILLVKNIDIDCGITQSEVLKKFEILINDIGQRVERQYDEVFEYNHADYFIVRYASEAFAIRPGETRRMPRYLAEHYAKHLVNHILEKRGIALTHAIIRPKTLAEILVGVDTYFYGDIAITEGMKTLQEFNTLNDPSETTGFHHNSINLATENAGIIADPIMGELKPEPKPLEEILKEADNLDEQITEESAQSLHLKPDTIRPTKATLIKELNQYGEELTGKESVMQLLNKLKKYA